MAELKISIEPPELAERLFSQILGSGYGVATVLPSGPDLEQNLRDLRQSGLKIEWLPEVGKWRVVLSAWEGEEPSSESEDLGIATSRLLATLASTR